MPMTQEEKNEQSEQIRERIFCILSEYFPTHIEPNADEDSTYITDPLTNIFTALVLTYAQMMECGSYLAEMNMTREEYINKALKTHNDGVRGYLETVRVVF